MLFAKISQTVKQLIENSLSLYVASFPRVAVASLVSALVTTGMSYIQKGGASVSAGSPWHWSTIITVIVSLLVVCYTAAFMMHQMMALGCGKQESFGYSVAFSGSRLLPLTMTMAMVYFVTALGMALFFLPGIFIMVVTSMVMPLIIFKQLKPFDAISASFQLVWGNVLRTLGVIIIPNVAVVVILLVLQLFKLPPEYNTLAEMAALFAVQPWVYSAVLTMYNELMLAHYKADA